MLGSDWGGKRGLVQGGEVLLNLGLHHTGIIAPVRMLLSLLSLSSSDSPCA